MKENFSILKQKCLEALSRMDLALENHNKHIPDDLIPSLIIKIKYQVQEMYKALELEDPLIYTPSYWWILIDSWSDKYGLYNQLMTLINEYDHLQKECTIHRRKLGEQEEKDS